jgi:hypothetical protein
VHAIGPVGPRRSRPSRSAPSRHRTLRVFRSAMSRRIDAGASACAVTRKVRPSRLKSLTIGRAQIDLQRSNTRSGRDAEHLALVRSMSHRLAASWSRDSVNDVGMPGVWRSSRSAQVAPSQRRQALAAAILHISLRPPPLPMPGSRRRDDQDRRPRRCREQLGAQIVEDVRWSSPCLARSLKSVERDEGDTGVRRKREGRAVESRRRHHMPATPGRTAGYRFFTAFWSTASVRSSDEPGGSWKTASEVALVLRGTKPVGIAEQARSRPRSGRHR